MITRRGKLNMPDLTKNKSQLGNRPTFDKSQPQSTIAFGANKFLSICLSLGVFL